jgi:ribosomal protein L12E/L44/L45/RPP1/RPP2
MKNELHQRLMSLASSLHERKLIKQMLMKEATAAPAGAPAPEPAGGNDNKAKEALKGAIPAIEGIDIIDDLLGMKLSEVIESIKALEPKAAAAAPAKDPEAANPEQDAEKNKGKKGKGKGKKGGTVSPQLAALPVGQILGAAVKQGGGIDKSPSLTESVAVLEFIKKSGVEGIEQLLKEEAIKIKILFLKGLPQEQE